MAAPRIDNQDLVVAAVHNVASPTVVDGQAISLQADASGNLLVNVAAGGSGGVQYVDGVTQVTPTGTVALGKNPSNILHALGLSAAGNLNVNLAEGTISGGNAAASATGAAVPASADYQGVNIGGNLVGVTGLALGGTTKAATVAIVDGAGNQITTFGGGTQFADNAASGGTPTGTLSMGWDSANSKIRALKVDATQNLLVDVSNASISVTQGTSPWVVSLASTTITGTVAVTQSTSPWVVAGNLTNNNAAPGAAHVGVLSVRANVAAPSWTEGNEVLLSADLAGNLRVTGTFSNNPVDTIGATVALNALNAAATVAVAGQNGCGFLLAVGTLVGTIVPEISYDGSTTWVASKFYDPAADTTAASIVFGANNTVTSRTIVIDGGVSNVRVRVSAFTSGTANATLRATSNQGGLLVNQGAAPWSVTFPSAQHVIVDSVIGTVTVAGTVTANQGGAPWSQNLIQLNSVALGSPSSYGTSPGAVSAIGVNAFVTNTVAVTLASTTITGTVAVTQSTSPWVVAGGLTNNNAVPGANNVGALSALANAANPIWTEGDLVLASVDLSGNQRVKVNSPLPAGTNVIGHVITDSGSTTAVTGNVNQVIGVAGFEKITDGTNTAAVKAASTAAVVADPSLVVQISPNNPLLSVSGAAKRIFTQETTTPLGANATFVGTYHDTTIDGTVYVEATIVTDQASGGAGFRIQQTDDSVNAAFVTLVSATVQVAVNTLARISGPISSRFWRIVHSNGATPQTTVEINTIASSVAPGCEGPFPNGVVLGLSGNLNPNPVVIGGIDGSALVRTAYVKAGSVVPVASDQALVVAISPSNFPTSVALADNLVNPTTTEIGANLLGWDATNTVWRRVQVDAATGTLKVDGSGSTQPVSGTVTANQGTNPWTIQGDSASGAAKAGNPTQIGGVFNTTQPTVTTGQTVEAQSTARGALIVATGADAFAVTLASTTITGTVAVTQSTSPWVENLTQVAGVALGATAVTNFGTAPAATAVPGVNASLFIGTTVATAAAAGVQLVGIEGRAGTSLETTAGVLDQNLKNWANTVLGVPTNFGTTPGAVVVGSVNSSLFIGTVAAVAASAGVQKVGISGGAGTSLETSAGVIDINLKNVGNAAITLGAKTSANSIPVVLATDEAALPVKVSKLTTVESTTPLAGNTTFVGSWHDTQVDGTVYAEVWIFTDQVSGANGLRIQATDDQSSGNFLEQVTPLVAVAVNQYTRIAAPISHRYWRVAYSNGATLQTVLNIESTASAVAPTSLGAAPVGGPVLGKLVVNPVIVGGLDTSSLPRNIQTNASGAITIVGGTGTSLETTAGVLDTNLKNVGNAAVTLGAKTSANSIPVVLATDEATLPVSIAGTVNVSVQNATLSVTQSTSPWVVQDNADGILGVAAPSIGHQIAGLNGTNLRAVQVDVLGGIRVSEQGGVGEILQSLLLETRAMKAAIVQMVTEAGSCLPEDFSPGQYQDIYVTSIQG